MKKKTRLFSFRNNISFILFFIFALENCMHNQEIRNIELFQWQLTEKPLPPAYPSDTLNSIE